MTFQRDPKTGTWPAVVEYQAKAAVQPEWFRVRGRKMGPGGVCQRGSWRKDYAGQP